MIPGPPSLEDLVLAICEGQPVDWDALEREGSPGFQNKLAALRVVESIARVHRAPSAGDEPPDSLVTSTGPARWGHLDLLEHLASGAFGDVYRAWDPGLDREVALKLLRRDYDADAQADEELEEGRLLAKVRHPNVVTVHGAARFDGRAGVWMEFVRGRTLAEMVAHDGPLPAAQVASIGIALCHALSAVHGVSLVHRDVKPQNVMVSDDGRVVLMDFGAGSAIRHAGLQQAGTPRYLAPEVMAGAAATVQSDVYGVGATLGYLLTGNARGHADFRPNTRIERRLLATLSKATDNRPSERFESDAAFAGVLEPLTKSSRTSVVALATAALVSALVLVLWAALRTSNLEDPSLHALESSWQTAIPTRAPLTPDQAQTIFASVQGTFSLQGILAGMTAGANERQALVTFDPGSGDSVVWLTYPVADGYADSPGVWPDASVMTYVWNDVACGCASLRSVNRAGRIRTLVSGSDIVAIVSGATTSRLLPILIGRKATAFELAVVDTESGAKRVLKTLSVDPRGFSLSPDGRFVAFDMPHRDEPGGALDVIIHEISTSREWPLLDTAGDRSLPVWSPRGDQLVYLESFKDTTVLRGVRVSNGHQASRPALLRRDLGRPGGIGFVDDSTFAYWLETGRSDVMVVEAAANGTFHGQKPRRISEGSTMPALSPDGRWLAWSDLTPRTGGLRVTGSDGRAFRLFHPSLDALIMPAWSDDSTQLAFWDVSRLSALLKITNVENGTTWEVLRMTHPPVWPDFDLAWIPGGRELLITPQTRPFVALDTMSGHQRMFHVPAQADAMDYPRISRDGHWLAFCDRLQHGPIHVVPLSSGGQAQTIPVSAAESLIGWWSDRSLLEVREVGDPEPSSRTELWRRPLDGAPPEPLGITGTNMDYITVSSDARRIAYSTQTNGRELWLLKPVGPN